MNTPELKAGQRFLSRLEADNEITEVTVKQVTADGAFIKCSWSYRIIGGALTDQRTQWFAAGELSVLHILEDDADPPKPVTVMGLDPAWRKDDKAMIVSAELMAEGIKFTDIKEAVK